MSYLPENEASASVLGHVVPIIPGVTSGYIFFGAVTGRSSNDVAGAATNGMMPLVAARSVRRCLRRTRCRHQCCLYWKDLLNHVGRYFLDLQVSLNLGLLVGQSGL